MLDFCGRHRHWGRKTEHEDEGVRWMVILASIGKLSFGLVSETPMALRVSHYYA